MPLDHVHQRHSNSGRHPENPYLWKQSRIEPDDYGVNDETQNYENEKACFSILARPNKGELLQLRSKWCKETNMENRRTQPWPQPPLKKPPTIHQTRIVAIYQPKCDS